MEDPVKRNLARAEEAAQVGYMPWYGADVAALSPQQMQSMQSTQAAGEAFGLAAPGSFSTGLPQAQTFAGGMQGYSSAPMFNQAVYELSQNNPNSYGRYQNLYNGQYLQNNPLTNPATTAAAGLLGSMGGDGGGVGTSGGYSGFGPSDTSYTGFSDAAASAGQTSNVGVTDLGTSANASWGGDGGAGYGTDGGVAGVGVGSSSGINGMDAASDASAGGGGGGGGGCVIATHAVAHGSFTPREKKRAVVWCTRTLHNKWWGETIRKGYRWHGNRAIAAGKAHEYYDEFRDFIRFATGSKRNAHTAKVFAWRSVQFFVTGLFLKG
jgi:hypothetical protein